jgi:hypothetical protein
MNRHSLKKLALSRETIRSLQDVQLRRVVGGTSNPCQGPELPRIPVPPGPPITAGPCSACICPTTSGGGA